ncbi:MAG: ABC transporter substrate-binding protein [Acidimicrobiales bacterium]
MSDHDSPSTNFGQPISRRTLLKGIGVGAAAVAGSSVLAACGSGLKGSGGGSSTSKLTIGYVSPKTGGLAGFAVPDDYVLSQIRSTSQYTKGFKAGGKQYTLEIIEADSQSDPNIASQAARNLILNNHVDLMVTSSAPETTNPVAVVCEAQGVPCCSTVVPWESWYYAGLGAKPPTTTQSFQYNTMFFFGLADFGKTFVPMWNRISTNKVIGEMFPNDADGNAFRMGWPPLVKAAGYTAVDGGAYQDGTTDYTTMISLFKSHDCEIYLNGPLPPDFNTFMKQASQQGYKPKLATVAKVLLFPSGAQAIGDLCINIATDAWWTPFNPYKSSLDGKTCADLAEGFQTSTGQQWNQGLGSAYSLFEVAYNALSKASDPHDKTEVAANLHSMSYSGMCGPIDFANGPVPGAGIIKPLGVQWKKGAPGKFTNFPYAMFVVDNSDNPAVPLNGTLEPTNP